MKAASPESIPTEIEGRFASYARDLAEKFHASVDAIVSRMGSYDPPTVVVADEQVVGEPSEPSDSDPAPGRDGLDQLVARARARRGLSKGRVE